jgi:hemoglobin
LAVIRRRPWAPRPPSLRSTTDSAASTPSPPVVDDFIDRIMIDPALNDNPLVDQAHHRVGKAGFKYLVTERVGGATGGPQKYTGRSMRDSHVDLKITEGEWVGFCKDFQDTLDKFKVPAAEQQELFAIVQSTKTDIVSVTG